jgi:hypothetical protein
MEPLLNVKSTNVLSMLKTIGDLNPVMKVIQLLIVN